jgi:rod shape-determining protein MreD
MTRDAIHIALLFATMWLMQVLIFNYVILFNIAVPFVFIYFIIRLRIEFSTGWLLTLAFLLGLSVDICSDTLGLNALCCTILAMAKKKVFYAYVPKDDKSEHIIPSLSALGLSAYSKYLFSMVAFYCVLLFSIEYFSFISIKEIAIMAFASTILTFILLVGIDCLMIKPREKRL